MGLFSFSAATALRFFTLSTLVLCFLRGFLVVTVFWGDDRTFSSDQVTHSLEEPPQDRSLIFLARAFNGEGGSRDEVSVLRFDDQAVFIEWILIGASESNHRCVLDDYGGFPDSFYPPTENDLCHAMISEEGEVGLPWYTEAVRWREVDVREIRNLVSPGAGHTGSDHVRSVAIAPGLPFSEAVDDD